MSKVVVKNRFKYKSFSQQLAEISADVNTAFELSIASPGDHETSTFFYMTLLETLQKNFDPSYIEFTQEMLPLSRTLSLILFNKDKIFGIINDYLQKPYSEVSGGIENVLKLISQLSRDLRGDFYPYFQDIFTNLANLFAAEDAQFVNSFFKCICFLLKFLQKWLIQDIENVLSLFIKLYFNHPQEFVQRLSAQSLAFLLRQSPSKKTIHKKLLLQVKDFMEEKTDEEKNRISHTLGYLFYYEIENVSSALWSNCHKLIKPFLQLKEEFVFTAFLEMIDYVCTHVNQKTGQHYIHALASHLPTIDHNLCLRVFIKLMLAQNHSLFTDSSILINVLDQTWSDCPMDTLSEYLSVINSFNIDEECFPVISKSVIHLISNGNIDELTGKLADSHYVAEISGDAIIKYADSNFESILPHLKTILEWARPNPRLITDSIVKKTNNEFKKNRDRVIPIFQYIHDVNTYNIMKNLKDLSIAEYGVLFSLMGEYEPKLLILQPPKFIDFLGERIQSEEALKIILHLVNVCYRFHPDWLNTESSVFQTLFEKIDFNTENYEIQKLGTSILYTFLSPEKPLELLNGDEVIIKTAQAVINIADKTNELLRNGEALINRLESSIQSIQNLPKLLNFALAFARADYLRFRDYDANLLGSIIKFDPNKFGPLIIDELEKTYPWLKNTESNVHLFANTLFKGIQKASYVDQKLVNLILQFCHREGEDDELIQNKVLMIETLASSVRYSKYNEQVEEAGYSLLKSIQSQIRSAAFNLIFTIVVVENRSLNEQQRDRIKTFLEVFVNAENIQVLSKFAEFIDEYKFMRPFISNVVVSLSIGICRDFLSEKTREKKKYKQKAANILQALACFESSEVRPFIKSFLIENPTSSDIRRFPKFFIPMITRIPHLLNDFLPDIANFLEMALKKSSVGSREMNNSMNAAALFFESKDTLIDFHGFEKFADNCLSVLEHALNSDQQSSIRLTSALSIHFPNLFSQHDDVIYKIISKLRDVNKCSSEIINIITKIINEIPKFYQEIINAYKEILEHSKLFKREQIWQSFNIFLSFLKESNIISQFSDILVTFLLYYRHIETIPIASGVKFNSEQFSKISTLIAYPLSREFRQALIPLISESLGKYSESFIKLNEDDLNEKTLTYNLLDSAGDFSFIFALQCFADLQLNDFSLRSAAVGFISRVIQTTPSIVDEYVLPAIQFHVKKRHAKIPPNEILIILQSIIKTIPDILPSIRRLASEPFFLSLGSFDAGVRSEALVKLNAFINMYSDWNIEEIGNIFFPLLCQLSTTPGIEDTLSILYKYATPDAIKTLLRRLIREIKNGSTIHLLIALCKAKAFPPEQVAPALLNVITNDKNSNKMQLRLIPALLSVDKSVSIIHKLISTIAPKLSNKDMEVRKIGQASLTELVVNMSETDYFIMFQDLRHFLDEGRKIPVLFLSLNNMLHNAATPQGSFDSFIQLFAEVLLEDIFGYMGEMRNQKAKEIPEAKKCVSFDSFGLLAKYITFSTHSRDLLDTILKKFDQLRKIEQSYGAKKLIQNLANGFVENETVDAKTLVDTVLYLLNLSDTIIKNEASKKEDEENKIYYGRAYESELLIEKPIRAEAEDGNQIAKRLGSNYLVSLMAVRLLYVFFERDLFDTEDKDQEELLTSLLNRLWNFIKRAQDTETLVVSLSILRHYIELPSFSKYLPDVVSFLTITISKLKSASDPFGTAVFSLLTAVLTHYENLEMPTPFTRALVSFCAGQLDVHDSCDSVFGVLKLIMNRRKDIPEIYDLVQPALELCIRALSPDIRKHSALFVSQFMTTYKMSPELYRKHLKFALANLSSSKAVGRKALLTFFSHYISDSTDEQIDPYSELILVHLGARIANEADERIVPKLRKVIGKLLTKVSGSRFLSMWNLMVKWASTSGKQVRTGLLLLAVSVEYCSEAMENLIEPLQQIVDVHITSENNRVKIASTELHKQIVAAYHTNEASQLKLLSVPQLIELIEQRETTRVGCELLQWYFSELSDFFTTNENECIQLSNATLKVVISWHGIIQEASEALYFSLFRMDDPNDLGEFFMANYETIMEQVSQDSKIILPLMRVFVKIIIDRECDNESFLKNTLILLTKAKEEDESKSAAEKALELLRHNVDVEVFTRNITLIVEEEKQRKEREEIERQVEEELNPEEYKLRIKNEREKKKEEERRKRYLTQGDEKGTLHPYDVDGKKVESVPLAPEFR